MSSRLIFLVVSFPTLACAQATAPAAEPAMEPPSFPSPPYTPAGTGAPIVGQPGAQVLPVPRSPNTRVLPSMPEPGLWAADDLRAAKKPNAPPPDADELLLPQPSPGAPELLSCRQRVLRASRESGQEDTRRNLPRAARECVTARLLMYCILRERSQFEEGLPWTPHLEPVTALLEKYKREVWDAFLWQSKHCDGFKSLPGIESIYTTITARLERQFYRKVFR